MAITTVLSNLRIPQRLRSLGNSFAQKELDQLKYEARIDRRALDLALIGAHTPPYNLVRFYMVVSPWCDRKTELKQLERSLYRIDYGQYDKARKALLAIGDQEERCRYGVNQTTAGETPTVDTTLLGGDCSGLTTNTVTYWEDNRYGLGKEPALLGVANSATIAQVIDTRALGLLTDGLVRWKSLFENLINS
jgi:hypothetical protein